MLDQPLPLRRPTATRGGSWETVVAGLTHGRQLWFGNGRNVGRRLRQTAHDLGLIIHLAT